MRDATEWVERLHAVIDELAAPIAKAHAHRLRCRPGCSACCVDDITVFEIEADVIVAYHQELLGHSEPHPEGACAFLDADGRCRIYEARPYVCRTQGLPLRWLDEDEEGASAEARDICPINDPGGPPLEELPADQLWGLGPFEERLADRQRAADGGEGHRVALRELFTKSASVAQDVPARRKLPIIP